MNTRIKSGNNKVEILIAEDSSTQAEQLKSLLDKHGYHVLSASNGKEAFALVQQYRPMVVISDIIMPEMDGYELCRQIKANTEFKQIPVILLTALSSSGDVIRGLECGADNFITKPYNEKYLISRINYLLANMHLQDMDESQLGLTIHFGKQKYFISSSRLQIFNLLLSTYETAIQKNQELERVKEELRRLNEQLEARVSKRTAELQMEIAERKKMEEAILVSHNVLEIANRCRDMNTLLREFIAQVWDFTGCSAVGIRILDKKGNIPYQAYKGFSQKFYESESPLSIKSDQCMCINVIKGTTDPKLPYYTKDGSFYTGSTTRVLATVSEKDKGVTRNVCNDVGYESVALVPIRLGGSIIGLIHAADPQENVVLLEKVEVLERIAIQLGLAIGRVQSEETQLKLKKAVEASGEVVFMTDCEGIFTFVNPEFTRLYGYEPDEIIGNKTPRMLKSGILKPEVYATFWQTLLNKQVVKGELVNRAKDGRFIPIEGSANPILDDHGNAVGFLAVQRDITERKRAEEQLRESLKKLQKIMKEVVSTLSSIVEKRDPYTAGHQCRVADLACTIAKELGLPEAQIDGVHVAGILHDIGKIYVPAEILGKSGRLSEYEFNLIRMHPRAGKEILESIDFPWPVAQIVLQHHERLNGTGYPEGIMSEKILMEAKIMAVADVVEAMASHRPYRPALGIEKALEEIRNQRGILFDPQVVDSCCGLFEKKAYRLQ